ncbi:hypothetical protein [Saezia sanguinis]|uniref:hypothetical protein n=1 Tax=Saezia sanguinis TaxID=1965230 RepID=UPI00302DDFF7
MIDLYFESLSELCEKTKNFEYPEIESVLFIVGYNIGYRYKFDEDVESVIKNLKKFVIEFIQKNSIEEGFFIRSLVHETTDFLVSRRFNQAEPMAIFLSVLEDQEKENMHETSKKGLKKFKDPKYTRELEDQTDLWHQIIANKFTLANRRAFYAERMAKNYRSVINGD